MSHKVALTDCKSGRDFAQWANHNPQAIIARQTGSHMIIKGPLPGSAVIPVHCGDLPCGTKKSVLKMLALIGLAMLMLMLIAGVVFASPATAAPAHVAEPAHSSIYMPYIGVEVVWVNLCYDPNQAAIQSINCVLGR